LETGVIKDAEFAMRDRRVNLTKQILTDLGYLPMQ
jgi:hypothetical protein